MHEELSIEKVMIELPIYKLIKKFNTIEETNIYMIEQPPEFKNVSGII